MSARASAHLNGAAPRAGEPAAGRAEFRDIRPCFRRINAQSA